MLKGTTLIYFRIICNYGLKKKTTTVFFESFCYFHLWYERMGLGMERRNLRDGGGEDALLIFLAE